MHSRLTGIEAVAVGVDAYLRARAGTEAGSNVWVEVMVVSMCLGPVKPFLWHSACLCCGAFLYFIRLFTAASMLLLFLNCRLV